MPFASNLNFGYDMTIEFWLRTSSAYRVTSGAWYGAQWILDKDISYEGNPDWAVALMAAKSFSTTEPGDVVPINLCIL